MKKNNYAATRYFGVSKCYIRLWEKAKLKQMPNAKQAHSGEQTQYPLIEKDLIDWVESQKKDGYIIIPMYAKLQFIKISKAAKY